MTICSFCQLVPFAITKGLNTGIVCKFVPNCQKERICNRIIPTSYYRLPTRKSRRCWYQMWPILTLIFRFIYFIYLCITSKHNKIQNNKIKNKNNKIQSLQQFFIRYLHSSANNKTRPAELLPQPTGHQSAQHDTYHALKIKNVSSLLHCKQQISYSCSIFWFQFL